MFEIILTLAGVLLGFLLSTAYERFKDHRLAKSIRVLLSREISSHIDALSDLLNLLSTIDNTKLPSIIKPMTIEEIAYRVEQACRFDAFEVCRRDLPAIGPQAMKAAFSYYEHCRQVPITFREIERWAGNIRNGLFEDNIRDTIKRAKDLNGILAG